VRPGTVARPSVCGRVRHRSACRRAPHGGPGDVRLLPHGTSDDSPGRWRRHRCEQRDGHRV